MPVNADQKYKDDGFSWGDFLGTENTHKKEFYTYEYAKSIVHNFNLKTHSEWVNYIKVNSIDQKIPREPYKQYNNDGFSWSDFLGYKPIRFSKPALISILNNLKTEQRKR